jgi:transcriptional/translational regulatory protein YebC/TACO1
LLFGGVSRGQLSSRTYCFALYEHGFGEGLALVIFPMADNVNRTLA